MRSSFFRRFAPLLLAAVPMALLPSASASGAPAGTPMHTRITNRQILGTSTSTSTSPAAPAAPAAPSGLPSKQDQIKVLTAALNTMQASYARYADFSPGPQDIFDYGIGNLWKQGIDGAGTTIAVIEGWDLPGIAAQVHSFDQDFGLPDPQISTIYPAGPLPATCPPGMVKLGSYGSCDAWGGELALDVISAHLIAPYAKIVISATPADTEETDDAASQVAPPEMMKALEYIAQNHVANVISISDGTGESTYSSGQEEITAQDPGELAAAAAGIPVLVATGDCGVVQNLATANGQCEDVSPGPDTAAWDDSPWVTAVGGSVPDVSTTSGQKLGPDPLWDEPPFSEGAGYSSVFTRPGYQNGVANITQSPMRSVPDLTMDAQDGTSEAAPMLNGVLALATQVNHGNIGPINPLLYGVLGPRGAKAGIADVISGNDSATTPAGTVTVPGFSAAPGFDVASGWGTVNAATFVPSLAAATRASSEDQGPRHEAATDLAQLEHGVQLSATGAGGTEYLLAGGFLPGHPVHLTVDGRAVATLTATTLGTVTDMIDPAALNLPAGSHQVQLSSLLITETGTFKTK